jgi:hypothetical protein
MPHLAEIDAELEEAMLVQREGGAAPFMLDRGDGLDAVIIGDEGG